MALIVTGLQLFLGGVIDGVGSCVKGLLWFLRGVVTLVVTPFVPLFFLGFVACAVARGWSVENILAKLDEDSELLKSRRMLRDLQRLLGQFPGVQPSVEVADGEPTGALINDDEMVPLPPARRHKRRGTA